MCYCLLYSLSRQTNEMDPFFCHYFAISENRGHCGECVVGESVAYH